LLGHLLFLDDLVLGKTDALLGNHSLLGDDLLLVEHDFMLLVGDVAA